MNEQPMPPDEFAKELRSLLDQRLDSLIELAAPIGSVKLYAGNDTPKRWLFCDGQPISRETYHVLFKAIGTKFGYGDGENTFNVPLLESPFEGFRYIIFTNR